MSSFRKNNSGSALIAVSLIMLVIGFGATALLIIYKNYSWRKNTTITEENIRVVEEALGNYIQTNGRLPCPAPLDAPLDSSLFGQEAQDDCKNGAAPGITSRVKGRDGKWVRIGTIPTRTLNVPDRVMFDGWKNRLVFSVTEELAKPGVDLESTPGAIILKDPNDNSLTAQPGEAMYALVSFGPDDRGAYNAAGIQIQPCEPGTLAGENCDYDDAVFIDTMLKNYSFNPNGETFSSRINYITSTASSDPKTCIEKGSKVDIFFLSDNTGSMGPHIAKVRSKAQVILDALQDLAESKEIDIAYGVGSYQGDPKEGCGGTPYRVIQPITKNKDLVSEGIKDWHASGGCDVREANFYALSSTTTSDDLVGWRDKPGRLIIWMGDAPSHEYTIDEETLIETLKKHDVAVIGLGMKNGVTSGYHLNSYNQAENVTGATEGGSYWEFINAPATEVAEGITEAVYTYIEEKECD